MVWLIEAPRVAQDVLNKVRIGTGWHYSISQLKLHAQSHQHLLTTVDRIVCAHDGANIDVSDARLEWLQVILAQVLLGRVVVLSIPVGLDVIHSIVLARLPIERLQSATHFLTG